MTDTTEFDIITGMTVARLRRWDICDEDNVADASSRRLYANLKKFYSKIKHFVRKFCRKICSMISTYFFVSFDILQIMPEILTYLPVNLVDLIPSILTASIGYNSLSHNTLPSHGMENLEDGKDNFDFIFEGN